MMRNLALAMMLSGCGNPPLPEQQVQLTIPDNLRSCAPAVLAPLPPAVPTTPALFYTWAKRTQQAWMGAARARDDCAHKLEKLNRYLVEDRPGND